MNPKRFRVVLVAALAIVGVLATCVTVVALRECPDPRYTQIRKGMKVAEVTAIMGRQADHGGSYDPPPGTEGTGQLLAWQDGNVYVAIWCDSDGVVAIKNRYGEDREPLWTRLRHWLRL